MDVGANPTVTKEQMRHSEARITLEAYGHVIGDSCSSTMPIRLNFRLARHSRQIAKVPEMPT
jgi:hypothetical protein